MRGLVVFVVAAVLLGGLGLGFRFGPKQPDGRPAVWWALSLLAVMVVSVLGFLVAGIMGAFRDIL